MENPNTTKAKELFLQALGQASMRWNPRPSNQTFDTAEASGIADREFPKIEKLIEAGFARALLKIERQSDILLEITERADEEVELRKRDG